LRKGKDLSYRQEIGRVVYEAMIAVGFGVPANARFQVVSEHDADNFRFDAGYLCIDRSDDLVIIQITWSEGRTAGQKKVLYKAISWLTYSQTSIKARHAIIARIDAYSSPTPNCSKGDPPVAAPDGLWLLSEKGLKVIYPPESPDAPDSELVKMLFPEALVLPMKRKPVPNSTK